MRQQTTSPAGTATILSPCPTWCDPAYCLAGTDQVTHCGTPTLVRTGDADYTLTLSRLDEAGDPEAATQPPVVHLEIESVSLERDVTTLEIRLDEVPQVIGALTVQQITAQFGVRR